MKKFFNEFKEFITRGNVLDMAIGVIIATAFGKITTSLVGDVFMPLIGYLIGGIDLSALNITLSPAVLDEAGEVVKDAVVIGIGTFLTTVIDFILVAFVVFLVVKAFNTAKKKLEEPAEPETPPEEPEPTKEELLLTRNPRPSQEAVTTSFVAFQPVSTILPKYVGKCPKIHAGMGCFGRFSTFFFVAFFGKIRYDEHTNITGFIPHETGGF